VQPNVCFGSKPDIEARPPDVSFTPKSGHGRVLAECPLCAKSGSGRNRRDVRSTAPHQTAMRTARRSKWEIRRHSERRCLNDSSVAVSQAGVNDFIAVKYSHRCSGWPVCRGIAPMRGLDLRHEKSFDGKEFNDEFMKALFGQTQAKRTSISTTMMCVLCR